MCGRYASSRRPEDLIELFEADLPPVDGESAEPQPAPDEPDWNIAPTKSVPVVVARVGEHGSTRRLLVGARWGLVPHWAKDVQIGARMINARVESVLDKPAFRDAVVKRRCLLPADGWYEWQQVETDGGRTDKRPYFLRPADGSVLAMAGVCAFWRDPAKDPDDRGAWLRSVAVITMPAESALERVHDRMPLHVERRRWAAWLDPATTGRDAVADLLVPPSAGLVDAWPVDRRVGSVRENDAGLTEPAGPTLEHVQPTLL